MAEPDRDDYGSARYAHSRAGMHHGAAAHHHREAAALHEMGRHAEAKAHTRMAYRASMEAHNATVTAHGYSIKDDPPMSGGGSGTGGSYP